MSSVVPVPCASATNERPVRGGPQGGGQFVGAQGRQVGGQRGDGGAGGAARAVLERRVQAAVGRVGHRPGAQHPDDVGGGRVVGDHHDLPDGRAGEGGRHGVGEEGQHQVVVRRVPAGR